MLFQERNRLQPNPLEGTVYQEPAPEPANQGSSEKAEAVPHYPLTALTLEEFRSQSDPQKQHEMLLSMIQELGNEDHSTVVRDKLLTIVVRLLQDINEETPENKIIVQARASRSLEDPLGRMILNLPKNYRATVDTAYNNARRNAGFYHGNVGLKQKRTEHTVKL